MDACQTWTPAVNQHASRVGGGMYTAVMQCRSNVWKTVQIRERLAQSRESVDNGW